MTIPELKAWLPTGLPGGTVQLFPGTPVVAVQGFVSHFIPLKLKPKKS